MRSADFTSGRFATASAGVVTKNFLLAKGTGAIFASFSSSLVGINPSKVVILFLLASSAELSAGILASPLFTSFIVLAISAASNIPLLNSCSFSAADFFSAEIDC